MPTIDKQGPLSIQKDLTVFRCSECGEYFVASLLTSDANGIFSVVPPEYQRAAACFVCGAKNKRS